MTSLANAKAAPLASLDQAWLKRYYAIRALFSAVWVGLALAVGRLDPAIGIALALIHPAWNALANGYDARRSGGLGANPTQAANLVNSAAVTLAIAVAATRGFHAIIGVIGVWAGFAGVLQLATAVRRWRTARAQWPMLLSGAQSALAGIFFVKRAFDPSLSLSVADIAPYAAFGAFYFTISAVALARAHR
jgi:hypothetical protein